MLRVYQMLSVLLVVVLTWTPLGRVKSRTLPLTTAVTHPVLPGLWVLRWSAWVVG
jgi:hypothetical protein